MVIFINYKINIKDSLAYKYAHLILFAWDKGSDRKERVCFV